MSVIKWLFTNHKYAQNLTLMKVLGVITLFVFLILLIPILNDKFQSKKKRIKVNKKI